MRSPAKNRLHPYEAGWLSMLVSMGVATEAEATEAQDRVARRALASQERQRKRRRRRRQRKDGLSGDDG
jgi:hypothetical protein